MEILAVYSIYALLFVQTLVYNDVYKLFYSLLALDVNESYQSPLLINLFESGTALWTK